MTVEDSNRENLARVQESLNGPPPQNTMRPNTNPSTKLVPTSPPPPPKDKGDKSGK